mgnify:CR=1 FL=1
MLNINEGEPLTYALIKSMVSKINALENRVVDLSKDNQFIEVKGKPNKTNFGDGSILIYCGSESYNRKQTKTTFSQEVKFKDASFGQIPIVIAGINNPTEEGAENAIVTVSKVTTTGFQLNINVLGGGPNKDNKIIQVDYIAIGPRQKKSDNQ